VKRDLSKIQSSHYDLLVIGGGIYGISIARDAALRGMRVALVEKQDFGHATSFNSLKVIHGGLRYLQHLDIPRMRQSIYERMVLMRIAPHLVHPLPFLIPTYSDLIQGKVIMRLALALNDLIGFDRNRLGDPGKFLPGGQIISRRRCLQLVPGISQEGVTGAVIWHDGQIHNSERLIIALLKGAVSAGAAVANYVEVRGLLRRGHRVYGVHAIDKLTGEQIEIEAKIVANAAGPWVQQVLGFPVAWRKDRKLLFSKAMNLLIKKQLVTNYAVGVTSSRSYVDDKSLFNKGRRLFFLVPWRKYTLIGTTHSPFDGDVDAFEVTPREIEDFVTEINTSYPGAALKMEDVHTVYSGLLPMNEPNGRTNDVSLVKQPRIYDHAICSGLAGLITIVGVKLTEARNVAEKATDLICRKLGGNWAKSLTATTPVDGGKIEQFGSFINQEISKRPYGLRPEVIEHLVYNYGSTYSRILKYLEREPTLSKCVSQRPPIIKAEIVHAVREEMAMTLSDVFNRRTELGLHAGPSEQCLEFCAAIMAKELAWDQSRLCQEIETARGLMWHPEGVYN